jgi:outer membrane murein-binding lipoprotein Lpp
MDKNYRDLFNSIKKNEYTKPLLMIIAVIVIAIIIGPKISGFTVSENKLKDCESNLEDRSTYITQLELDIEQTKDDLSASQNTVNERDTTIKQMEEEYLKDINELDTKYDDAIDAFNNVMDTEGTRKCCVLKEQYGFDEYDSFDIIDNEIECSSNGSFAITC